MPLWQLTASFWQKTHRVLSTGYLESLILLQPLAQTARIEPDTIDLSIIINFHEEKIARHPGRGWLARNSEASGLGRTQNPTIRSRSGAG